MAATPSTGVEALHRLKLTEPPMYLTPSPELATVARTVSEHLFALLKPYTPKSPFDRLLVDSKFDAEQIWQQIDLQSQPLISSVRHQVNKFEKNPIELRNVFKHDEPEQPKTNELDLDLDLDGEIEEDDDDEIEDEDDMEEDDHEIENREGEIKEGDTGGVNDEFFDLEEMRLMEDDEDGDYGLNKKQQAPKKAKKTGRKYGEDDEEDNYDDEEEEDDEDDDDDEIGLLELAGDEDDSGAAENSFYKDFFTSNKKRDQNKKPKVNKEVEDGDEEGDEDEEDDDSEDGEEEDEDEDDEVASDEEIKRDNLSTHEKQLLEQRAKIEQVEMESLDAKAWTMQGEVNATKRPKNSALEVDLDWERNAKPPPVITEEVSQSIEELIMKRISEGHFDDVQRVNKLPSKAPTEMKELDENQSKKGLGELYADEYAQKTGLVSQALSFSDEQKKEATLIFKKLCLKLDALSHFHFTPKPVIEDMSIQTNVPALAMEEIAPLAVSDAAMLAPEEIFSGKGDIKEEAELTQADRKRRRASKKRKFKAENAKKAAKKPRENTQTAGDGKEES